LADLGYPVMIGHSRKSFVGKLTGEEVDGRLAGSLAAALVAARRGAHMLRVHDVAATVQALAVASAVTAS
jgi:dihydropteroate synthase